MSLARRKRAYVENNRGHTWKLDETGLVDIFALEHGLCNGPRCTTCGRGFCHHCDELPPTECPEKEETSVNN